MMTFRPGASPASRTSTSSCSAMRSRGDTRSRRSAGQSCLPADRSRRNGGTASRSDCRRRRKRALSAQSACDMRGPRKQSGSTRRCCPAAHRHDEPRPRQAAACRALFRLPRRARRCSRRVREDGQVPGHRRIRCRAHACRPSMRGWRLLAACYGHERNGAARPQSIPSPCWCSGLSASAVRIRIRKASQAYRLGIEVSQYTQFSTGDPQPDGWSG